MDEYGNRYDDKNHDVERDSSGVGQLRPVNQKQAVNDTKKDNKR